MEEVWKPIEGHEDSYHISNKGRVLSLARQVERVDGGLQFVSERILNPQVCKTKSRHTGQIVNRALRVHLRDTGNNQEYEIPRLVLQHFDRPPVGSEIVGYLDDNLANCSITNLYWTIRATSGKLTHKQVKEIKDNLQHFSTTDLAILYETNVRIINAIKAGRTWRTL